MSKLLPPSLGSLFGQPLRVGAGTLDAARSAADLPGATRRRNYAASSTSIAPTCCRAKLSAEVKIDGIRCLYITGAYGPAKARRSRRRSIACRSCARWRPLTAVPMVFDGEYVEDGGLEATISAFRSRRGNAGACGCSTRCRSTNGNRASRRAGRWSSASLILRRVLLQGDGAVSGTFPSAMSSTASSATPRRRDIRADALARGLRGTGRQGCR
jgi:hypothetical protein